MPGPYIHNLAQRRAPKNIGNKARNLRFLIKEGFTTPATHVCNWDAYQEDLQGSAKVIETLRGELEATLESGRRYAVRSSANLEDTAAFSFAGQFKTVLDAQGTEELLQSIQSIWASTRSPSVQSYVEKSGLSQDQVRMAVLIQEMVPSRVSGVSFSRNPLTGMDEVVVEAVAGSGEALVQGGVTPDRWVYKWGTWTAQPEDSAIEQDLVQEVVQRTRSIAQTYGRPVDLEWVFDGHAVYWVQLREITSPDVPLYSNRISREVFPGIIKPLIWSVVTPLVNSAWIRLLTELIGPNDLSPEDLARYFYCRAYFNMGTLGRVFEMLGFPRESLELLMGIEVEGPEKPSFRPTPRTYTFLPRMIRFALNKLRFDAKLDTCLPELRKRYEAHPTRNTEALDERELLERNDEIYATVQETAYYTIVTQNLMEAYNRFLNSRLGRLGVDFESFDLTGDMEELHDFEPNVHLAWLHEEYAALDEGRQAQIDEGGYRALSEVPGTEALVTGLHQFLERFGHLSDRDSDFSAVPWRENPDLVMRMVANYVPPRARSSGVVRLDDLDVRGLRRWILSWGYERARRYRLYRESVSSLYTYGFDLFRVYFMALGERLAQRGILASREEIFYLYHDEVRDVVNGRDMDQHMQSLIEHRKAEIQEAERIAPPTTIYGDTAPPVSPGLAKNLQGVATSRGHHKGPARVLRGLEDLEKLEEGDVLVIPYSEVGWTPLFTKAGAVVAESGGILSHSSIVAREYGIPAVVSVQGACLLDDGTLVTVDGYRGDVIVHEPEQGTEAQSPPANPAAG
jgi:pyruvate,water dikinase